MKFKIFTTIILLAAFSFAGITNAQGTENSKCGGYTGRAKKTMPDKSVISGLFQCGLATGDGVLLSKNEDILYKGIFANGKPISNTNGNES